MIGYSTQSKGYKIWNTETSKLVVSRDVTFDESSVDPNTIEVTVTEEDNNNIVVPGENLVAIWPTTLTCP